MEDLEGQCRRTGASCQASGDQKIIRLKYLSRLYDISMPDIDVRPAEGDEEIILKDKLLILHYFLTAKGVPLSGRTITFKELPEGVAYYRTFYKRSVEPILKCFAGQPKLMVKAAASFGGKEANFGDSSFTVNAFHRLPVTCIIWRGEKDLPPEGNIVFDDTISEYLPVEDIVVLCQNIAGLLIKAAGESHSSA